MENQTPITPSVTPQVVVEQPKQSNFLVILLSILLFIAVAIAGFFAFQTQRLVAELKIKNEELIVKTPEPTAEPITTTDPTTDWKTYTNKNFSFKYLNSWEVYAPQIEGNALNLYIGPKEVVDEIKTLFGRGGGFGGGKFLTFTISEVDNMPIYQSDEFQKVTMVKIKVGSVDATKYITDVIQDMQGFNKGDKIETIVLSLGNKYTVISLLDYQYKNAFDQILSTFKFID